MKKSVFFLKKSVALFKKSVSLLKKPVLFSMILSTAILSQAMAGEMRGGMGGPGGHGGHGGGMGGGFAVENDAEVQAVLDVVSDQFIQETFTDPDTGADLEYSLFVPAGYDPTQKYPLIMFIPDSTGSGKSAKELVEQYYGAAVWASEEEQEKHPSFVVVPAFSETVVDDNWNVSDQVETAVKMLGSLQEAYSIDAERMYTTGQSMGCMTSLYLNSVYPDLFAASLYVSGQWDISVLKNLESQTFFYITSAGDAKASGGQSEVMAMLEEDGVSYSYGEWNCKDEGQDEKVAELLSEGLPANMIRFEAEYTDSEGNTQTLTHMASFNYAYKLEAVRDWLFAQSK